MSTLKVNNLQVGQDGTATNNFTLYQPAVPDGTVRLGYGNSGSVSDLLVVRSTNNRIGIGTDTFSSYSKLSVVGAGIGGNALSFKDTTNLIEWCIGASTNPNAFVIYDVNNTSVRLEVSPTGNIIPGADASQDLGSSSRRWANIYSADLQLSNEGSINDVDGTWGQYTIQEGENDLFLLNRRNGKKYKFVLQEVN